MSDNLSQTRNNALIIAGLGIALLMAVFLSPFASQNPDGLDRVAKDQGFDKKELEHPPAKQLPFNTIFDSYTFRFIPGYDKGGLPNKVATSIAGLVGTLATFGLAWGIGKLAIRGAGSSTNDESLHSENSDQQLK
ncbi:PDGLE domain-containing protein [Aetokthonos hydrillicola Thurmond2011]|jgi:cobalt/nickel transport protein|uniref:PDGLE domain-containing protein n=1 Tax=Aetokthonos hydrillicola Thurmond2011 TaxID=2712845 RepID=A0AAP5I3S7_9CYAN|nr:PDGLE domain-containing protein [Aetokthonos hydrillicola]MBO3458600.1 cobalt transport protein [Aetokthonos hydrillicola CCALA 1050]MBW4585043.1 PDGLE domain-containing protein [Aetokthonos hydrillicola CCALA 1050]MDR9894196.1 PDGLE domain-containing protein [Aetokthonos hydrillicola Thurmond2011]